MTDGNGEADRNGESRRANGRRSDDDDPLAWGTIDSTVAYACPAFTIRQETVGLPDGTETDFDYLSEPPAVAIFPLTSGREVLLIEEWRQAVGRVNRGIPAGTVEREDADLEAAARRELREETGYRADRVHQLTTVEPANGATDSVHHYFLAENCEPAGEQDLDADESIRVLEASYEDFREAVRAGEVRDGRAVLAVALYELLGGE